MSDSPAAPGTPSGSGESSPEDDYIGSNEKSPEPELGKKADVSRKNSKEKVELQCLAQLGHDNSIADPQPIGVGRSTSRPLGPYCKHIKYEEKAKARETKETQDIEDDQIEKKRALKEESKQQQCQHFKFISSPSSKPTKKRSRDFPPKPNDADSTVPLDCLLHKRNLLAEIAVNCLDAGKLASMIPFCLIDRTKEELIQKVTEELEVMSKKRILAALEGKEASSSSESEESEQEFKPEEKGQSHSPEVNTPKTHDSNDRVSLTEEATPPQCPLEEGEIIDGAD
ncbi:unnamed protein product, partial [Mesorhabditis belari]|uniref:Uncharacterized protein n=1 Tax=Mesorhabditis belari TaxID=2138241 RepID=A0AAF3F4R5_9BILA